MAERVPLIQGVRYVDVKLLIAQNVVYAVDFGEEPQGCSLKLGPGWEIIGLNLVDLLAASQLIEPKNRAP